MAPENPLQELRNIVPKISNTKTSNSRQIFIVLRRYRFILGYTDKAYLE